MSTPNIADAPKTFSEIADRLSPETQREKTEIAANKLHAHLQGGTEEDVQSIQEFISFAQSIHKRTARLAKELKKLGEWGGYVSLATGNVMEQVKQYEELKETSRLVYGTAAVVLPGNITFGFQKGSPLPADFINNIRTCKDVADADIQDLAKGGIELAHAAWRLKIPMQDHKQTPRPATNFGFRARALAPK